VVKLSNGQEIKIYEHGGNKNEDLATSVEENTGIFKASPSAHPLTFLQQIN